MDKKFTNTIFSLFWLAVLAACSQPHPVPVDHGAGTVLRVDAALDAIVPPDYKIEKLHDGFRFTEGPVWLNEDGGYLLFSDIPDNVVYKWTPDGELTEFLAPVYDGDDVEGRSVGSNGLALDVDGNLLLCEQGARRIARMERDDTRTTVVDRYEGKRFNSPNDAVVHSDGSIYFTDPPYGFSDPDDSSRELDFSGIYRYSADGELTLLSRDLARPNGIGLSPDERTLYVANSDPSNMMWMAYPLDPDGLLGEGTVFFDVSSLESNDGPDGLAVDANGNVFASGPGGVWIFDPEGTHLGTIQLEEVPRNAAFGDADGKALYMTARSGLYRIRLSTRGLVH